MEDIKVHVVKYPDRTRLMMRDKYPDSGRQIARSTGTKDEKEADRAAAKREAELREGRYKRPSKMTWEEFRNHFDRNVMSGPRESTALAYDSTFNVFERKFRPGKLAQVNTTMAPEYAQLLDTVLADGAGEWRSGSTMGRYGRSTPPVGCSPRWARRLV
ncbi:hypothetical protein [Lacipirellula sp.]|uniref:hypothetical protein n=1 Tax=Lacipirellula sp. TaxID=2691419 RepID=UPI003D136B89